MSAGRRITKRPISTVPAGEKIMAALADLRKQRASGSAKKSEEALDRALLLGRNAYSSVREVAGLFIDETESRAFRCLAAALRFDQNDDSVISYNMIAKLVDEQPSVQMVYRLRNLYRFPKKQYDGDEESLLYVEELYREFQTVFSVVSEMNELSAHAEEIFEKMNKHRDSFLGNFLVREK